MRLGSLTLLSAAVLAGFLASPAYAVVEVQIADASGTKVYTGVSCGTNCTTVVAVDNDAAFNLDIQFGTSDIIGGLPSLTLAGLINANHAGNLTIQVSNTGFLSPLGGAELLQTVGTGPLPGSGHASLTAQGFYGTGAGNAYFCAATNTCTGSTPSVTLSSLALPFQSQVSSAAVNITSAYSLDEVLTYSFEGAGYADAGAILSVLPAVAPEPASVLLVGLALISGGLLFRKKHRSKRA
jgi:hypothetical protein